MPFVPAPNIVQVELRGRKDGQLVENRFHIDVLHRPTDTDLLNIATGLSAAFQTTWLGLMPSDVVLTELHQRSLHTQNDIERTDAFSPTTFGGQAGEPAPNNVTYCISLRSTSVGRSARGRLYWLGLSIDQMVTNHISAAARTAIIQAVEDVRAGIVALGYAWVIVSYIANGAPRVGGPVYFVVSRILTVDDVVDSQRRRLPGRGA